MTIWKFVNWTGFTLGVVIVMVVVMAKKKLAHNSMLVLYLKSHINYNNYQAGEQ